MTDKEKAQAQLQAILDAIPDEQAQALKKAASKVSGAPADQLTLQQAIEYLGREGNNPDIDRWAEAEAEKYFANIQESSLRPIEEAASHGDILTAAGQVMQELLKQAAEISKTTDTKSKADIIGKIKPDAAVMKVLQKTSGIFQGAAQNMDGVSKAFIDGIQTALNLFNTPETFNGNIEETIKNAAQLIQGATSFLLDYMQSDRYKAILQNLANLEEITPEMIEAAGDRAQEVKDLLPYIRAAIDRAPDGLEVNKATLPELLAAIRGEGDPGNPWKAIIEQARAGKEEFEAAQEAAQVLQVIASPADKVNWPMDKPNSVIWNLIAAADPDGQLSLDIVTSKKGSDQDAIIYYGINFDALEEGVRITKQLTPFDKLCYIAVAALHNAGNETVSATQIYYMMGNTTRPNDDDLQKVNDSLTKMGAARVYLDNIKETRAAKGYRHFKYDASLLPFERISAYIDGKLTESAIHLFREPPLISFAKDRNQITTFSRKLLESPISKTDANLRIQDYLLERIGHMKSPKSKAPRKMLFDTIYKHCNITTTKQRQRAPGKIRSYLDYYKKCGHIKGYTVDEDGITILL